MAQVDHVDEARSEEIVLLGRTGAVLHAVTARSLPDVDAAAVNTNYATEAGLKPSDAILREDPKGPYVNLIAVRKADADAAWVKDLVNAYHSPEVRAFVEAEFEGSVLPAW